MKEYLIFLCLCVLIGILPRLVPGRIRPKLVKGLDRLFWMFSLPAFLAFLGFALIEYVKKIGNLSTPNLIFLDLVTAFVLYYCGALAQAAGKMQLGASRCPRHEDVTLVCPECQGAVRDSQEGRGRQSGER